MFDCPARFVDLLRDEPSPPLDLPPSLNAILRAAEYDEIALADFIYIILFEDDGAQKKLLISKYL